MTEFEKWWEKHRASRSPHTCQSARGENLAALADKEIWQAALKWAYNELKNNTNGFFNIGKELEQLTQGNNQGCNCAKSDSPGS